jgi:hypothetical protein
MASSLMSFVRDRLEAEIMLIRGRDALLADLLNCPVLTSLPAGLRLRPGSDLSPARGLEMVLRHGWSFPEHWGIWSRGARSALHLTFDDATVFPITVELDLQAFCPPGLTQSVAISVNGRNVALLVFEPLRTERVEPIEIQAEDLSPEFSAEITFDISNPTAPADIEPSSDRRKLGVAIRRLRTR